MQLTCQVKDAHTVFYSIKKRIAYCNATHLPGWRWRQCFTLQKNELFTAVQLTCQVKDAHTVFYSIKKRIAYCNATHLPGWRWRQCFTLQKNELFTAVQLTCQVKDAHTVFYSIKKTNCLLQCNSPARLKMETVFYTTEEWTVHCSATHLPG